MPTLNPAFESVRTFSDFVDVYTSHITAGEAPRMTRNDLVRAWNILTFVSGRTENHMTIRYADINVSQSSMRTIVSKLNQLFRHVGVLASWNGLRIVMADFYQATVHTGHLDTSLVLNWDLGMVQTAGRRQDRVDTRHVNGHRARRTGRNAPLTMPANYVSNSEQTDTMSALAEIASMIEDFDAFAGIDSGIFLTLSAEIDGEAA